MTLLSIIQDAAGRAGYARPARVIGASDETAVRLLGALNQSGNALLRKHAWEGLIAEHTLTTDGNADGEYDMPTDYQRFVNATWWDSSNQWQLQGPVDAQDWARLKNGIVSVGTRKLFRIRGGKMLLHPVPGSGDTIKFEYVKKNWIVRADGTTEASSFAFDTDTVAFEEELLVQDIVWRFRKAQGLDYSEEKAEAEREIAKAIGHSGGSKVLNLGRATPVEGLPFGVTVDEGSWTGL